MAQRFGFAGALVPGVEVFALATAPLVREWGEALLGGGRLALRFRRPVYDGERVTVSATAGEHAYDVVLSGPDGSPRATGLAERPSVQREPAPYDDVPLPDALAQEPRPGPFGTVVQAADPQACAEYARAIGDDHPLYEQVVHPGLLLRLVNLALMSNVARGPWIHTASDCRFLRAARVGEDVAVRSRVTEVFSRKGHDYVRYDALVLASGQPVAEVHHEAIWRLAGQESQA